MLFLILYYQHTICIKMKKEKWWKMNISPPFLSTFLEEKNLKTVYVIDPVYSIDWRWNITIVCIPINNNNSPVKWKIAYQFMVSHWKPPKNGFFTKTARGFFFFFSRTKKNNPPDYFVLVRLKKKKNPRAVFVKNPYLGGVH